MIKKQQTGSIAAVLAVSVMLLSTAGCQTTPTYVAGSAADRYLMERASLPDYVPGEYFVYDDGTSSLVTAVSDGQVTWKHHNGATGKGYPNFIIPDLTWTSANRSSIGRTSAPPDLLWPLVPGKRGEFTFDQTITNKDGSPPDPIARRWTCTVEGTARVSVPAGQFDTVVMACSRYSTTSGALRATRRFYYAPEIGHYVIREDRHRSRSDTRRELVAYGFNSTLLPQPEQAELNQTLQSALTKNKDGRAAFWRSQSGNLAAMLVPFRSFKDPKGTSCREYRSIYSVKGRIGQHTREVCRQPDGHWQRVE